MAGMPCPSPPRARVPPALGAARPPTHRACPLCLLSLCAAIAQKQAIADHRCSSSPEHAPLPAVGCLADSPRTSDDSRIRGHHNVHSAKLNTFHLSSSSPCRWSTADACSPWSCPLLFKIRSTPSPSAAGEWLCASVSSPPLSFPHLSMTSRAPESLPEKPQDPCPPWTEAP